MGPMILAVAVAVMLALPVESGDHNGVFQPCADVKVQRSDGFTFGIAFSNLDSFYLNANRSSAQLSPCDSRLTLASGGSAQLAVFRPKIDEISLLTVNTTTSPSINTAGYMVAFAGRKYAARSPPVFVGNASYTITSFTLVLEFKKGTLQNMYWKTNDCSSCSGSFVCLSGKGCGIKTSTCKGQQGGGDSSKVDCSIGIQLAFSGTDKHEAVLNSWYEVSKLQQYSLYNLYSNLRNSLTDQLNRYI